MAKSRGHPLLIDGGNDIAQLERVRLGLGNHGEDWLQSLIHRRPEILPVAQIEPGLGAIVPVAREVPCGHGYIDNLFVTGEGEIVLAEAKLWANPQARREVVAQALDCCRCRRMSLSQNRTNDRARPLGFQSRN